MPPNPPNLDESRQSQWNQAETSVPPERWTVTFSAENEPSRLKTMLRERTKELNSLYALAHIAENKLATIEEMLEAVVLIIPPAWQYPGIATSEIIFQNTSVRTPGFRSTRWRQSAPITLNGKPVGEVTVCYLEERPPDFEGPFLKEERILLEAVAERVACMALRIITEAELRLSNHDLMVEREALRETNAALKVLMSRIEEEKRDIQRDVRDRVEKVLKPILFDLYMKVSKPQRRTIDLLNDSLEELTRPFASRLSTEFDHLTPTEVQICSMIKSGLRTKEIAELRGISIATVCRHRDRIRHKLGLSNTSTNLATYLKKQMP
ncbi:MAG: helix-turn-helix transcriptional regulator [bacterium]|nr:MAG: helix-turn-helix transcriptional regulator [bacterium]